MMFWHFFNFHLQLHLIYFLNLVLNLSHFYWYSSLHTFEYLMELDQMFCWSKLPTLFLAKTQILTTLYLILFKFMDFAHTFEILLILPQIHPRSLLLLQICRSISTWFQERFLDRRIIILLDYNLCSVVITSDLPLPVLSN